MRESGKTGSSAEPEITEWLREGGVVVAASERAARALTARYHRARRSEGLEAWPAPAIYDWQSFLRSSWMERPGNGGSDGRLLLDPMQERAVWAGIAGSSEHMATLLEGPRNRMAALAMQAHQLLCSFAPEFLRSSSRSGWQQDAAHFSVWLAAFDDTCRAGGLLSPSRLPLEMIHALGDGARNSDGPPRPPLLVAGFDRIAPVQRRFLDTWGEWREVVHGQPAQDVRYYQAANSQSELTACAMWCKQRLAADPEAKLLVITQDLSTLRGEMERTFQKIVEPADGLAASHLFEFSLGIPLSKVALARGAYLALRWLTGAIAEQELDWLISTGQLAADTQETITLQTFLRAVRQCGFERPAWELKAFLAQPVKTALPPAWVARMKEAKRRLEEQIRLNRSPLDWAEFVPKLLEAAGWPGARPLSSEEFQALRRWHQAVEACAALGFDGRRIRWEDFLSALSHALDELLFAPESHDAPIQIAGPAESAGLTADGIWFLGASEAAWPAAGSTHPLLPVEIQRAAGMPHATSQLDWELAHRITTRLLTSATEARFSFARQGEDAEARPSRLITHAVGAAQPLPAELAARTAPEPITIPVADSAPAAFPHTTVQGGASSLTHQSQCPFKAFATARLGADTWRAAEAGLTASQRGQLLHAVLHSIWGGSVTQGIRTLTELKNLSDSRAAFVAAHVSRAMQQELRPSVRERMPQRYLALEEQRLNRLINEWLDYELTRVDFEVTETEARRTVELAGLTFEVRLDRVDRLNDESLLVIDYKTGQVSPKRWETARPDDVQLPLYAGFALKEDEALGGLVFANVRSGDSLCFTGRVGDARATLLQGLGASSNLVKKPLEAEQIESWRSIIEKLAQDFLAGRSAADPREYPKTCEGCGLQALCRINEAHPYIEADDDVAASDSGAGDE